MGVRQRRAIFLAMSGVRVRNEKLLALGLTLPGFVERGNVIASLPSLGLLTIAALLPPNWEAEYEEVGLVDHELAGRLAGKSPDLVFISSLAARIDEAYALADALRANGLTVVLGGLHASAMPEEASQHADAVIVGEGERVMARLISDWEQERLAPIYRARDESEPVFEFGTGPLPRYDLLDLDRYNRLTLQTTRGCPLDCNFCAASRLISPYRRKPIERVAQELEAILELWPEAFIELADDNTFVHKKWARELVRLFKGSGVRWFTECDISVADDPDLLESLARSGCAQLLIGLESVDERALRETDSKSWKAKKRAQYLERIARIQSYGISVNGCFVLGFDADRESVFESTLQFIEESELSEAQVTVLTPFPGTGLYQRLKEENRLTEERFWDRCTLFDVVFEPAGMSRAALEDGFHWLVKEVYREDRVVKRKVTFRGCVRKARRRDAVAAG